MSIIPTWPIAAGTLVLGLALGTYIDHAVMAGRISDMKLEVATAKASTAENDLINLKAAAEVVSNAALEGRTQNVDILAKLSVIQRNQKNAPPAPLPADCKPGPVRLRNLAETATAADAAIARPVPSR